jgi:hypothetical protein
MIDAEGVVPLLDDTIPINETEGEVEETDDDEEACGDACCDDEDPFSEPGVVTTAEEDCLVNSSESTSPPAARKRQRTQKSSSRLEELARPKPLAVEPAPASPPPTIKREKKTQSSRPSLLLRLRPTNLEEAWEAFSASGFQEAPRFTYAHPEDVVTKHFEENSHVCFELLPEAKRICQRVQDEYGGPEAFMQQLYGERKIPAEELRDIVAEYLKDHNIEDKVEIRIVDNMLSAANVLKPGADEKYVVNIASGPISWNMVQGICDHEVGTHLLRMMNDEHQVWHGIRDRYKLANPWTTEEGFATLNTYQSMPCRLMYPQALRYYAVCRGAQCGFVELFHELRAHTSDPKRCWQMCCRIKRGMIDTSLPGAFYMDQAYFKGAVEILRHLEEVDFGRLYGGQIALQDLDKVHFLLRKEVVRLPRFLNSAETLKTYKVHCRKLIKENQIEAAVEKVCKPVFIRTAREFFKPLKQKAQLHATIAFGEVHGKDARSASVGSSRPLDAERLADLARPRQLPVTEPDATPSTKVRDFDRSRVQELSAPRQRLDPEATPEVRCTSVPRALNLARLEDLAKPRQLAFESESDSNEHKREGVDRRYMDPKRLLELALPRRASDQNADAALATSPNVRSSAAVHFDVPPPPEPYANGRVHDLARLAELAQPRKQCEEDKSIPCKCPPKAGSRRKKRSKCRILAMVQEQKQQQEDEEEAEENGEQHDAELVPDMIVPEERQIDTPHGNDSLDDLVKASTVLSQEELSLPSDASSTRVDLPSEVEGPSTDTWNAHPLMTGDKFLEPSQRAASEEPRAEATTHSRPDRKPRSRAVARARSTGSGAGAHIADRSGQSSGMAGIANGIGGRSALPFEDVELGGFSRRPRVPVGLPRGAAMAVAAANGRGAAAVLGADGAGAFWKPVPIKIMQFDFGL